MDKSEFKPIGDIEWLKTFGLNLSDDVKCDFTNCRDDSGWWFAVNCCNHIYLMCDTHTQKTMATVAALGHEGVMACKECGKTIESLENFTTPRKLKLKPNK